MTGFDCGFLDVYSIGFCQLDACWRGEIFRKYILGRSFRHEEHVSWDKCPQFMYWTTHIGTERMPADVRVNLIIRTRGVFAVEQFSLEVQNKKNLQRLSDSLVCRGRRILSMLDRVLTVSLIKGGWIHQIMSGVRKGTGVIRIIRALNELLMQCVRQV